MPDKFTDEQLTDEEIEEKAEVGSGDPVDYRGHDAERAKQEEPLLDVDAPPASLVTPPPGPDVMVRAQSTEEVEAQGGRPE